MTCIFLVLLYASTVYSFLPVYASESSKPSTPSSISKNRDSPSSPTSYNKNFISRKAHAIKRRATEYWSIGEPITQLPLDSDLIDHNDNTNNNNNNADTIKNNNKHNDKKVVGKKTDYDTYEDCPIIVGVAGGSGSGKTTLARAIIDALGEDHVSYISHDNYYKDLSHMTLEERSQVNFDHPDSLETNLLVEHLTQLKLLKKVSIPSYDFTTHSRVLHDANNDSNNNNKKKNNDSSSEDNKDNIDNNNGNVIEPRKIILVDGILIFAENELLDLFDMKIFVDTDDDIRLIRRLQRDTTERGRSVESVISQYQSTVRPMHQTYCEPSKRVADIIVPAGQGIQPVALDMCVSRLREIINFYQ